MVILLIKVIYWLISTSVTGYVMYELMKSHRISLLDTITGVIITLLLGWILFVFIALIWISMKLDNIKIK